MSADLPRRGHIHQALAAWYRDSRIAATLLTWLPLAPEGVPRPAAEVTRAFPIVGAAIGLVSGIVFSVCAWSEMAPLAAALLAVAAAVTVTGGRHEGGLAAAVGALGGGDPGRMGAPGVAAIVILLGVKAAALGSFLSTGAALAALVGAGAASRAAIPILMNALLPPDPADTSRPSAGDAWAAAAVGGFFALFVGIGTWLVALAASVVTGALLLKLARRYLAGSPACAVAAAQGVVEAAFLLAASVVTLWE